jgi:urease accessory protein
MIRATQVKAQHRWTETAADTVVLDFDDRHRRRMAMTGTRGLEFLLDLEKAIALRGGDALVLEDGRLIEVVAAPEPLLEIRGTDPQHLVRVAWHLGNRHLPTQITGRALRIRRDHVIEDMVKGLGARVIEIEAPFDPEGGAYAGDGHVHAAGETHGHAAHDHSSHDHGGHHHDHHAHGHDHHHHHDEHCGHDHHHDHSHAHEDK